MSKKTKQNGMTGQAVEEVEEVRGYKEKARMENRGEPHLFHYNSEPVKLES